MKYILLAAILILHTKVFSQTLTAEQDNAIKIEQAKLKEGKITYTEYQKRYDEIIAPKNQANTNPPLQESEKKTEVKPVETTSPTQESIQPVSPQTTPSNTTVNQSQPNPVFASTPSNSIKNSIYRPGDQLIKFANKRYIAMGLFAGGYVFAIVGAISATVGGGGVGALLLGMACMGTSAGLMINSISHIKKAGEYLNMQQDGAIK